MRFIRLEYNGGDWDQGIDADLNMLVQYNLRTQHKIAERPETRKVIQLREFSGQGKASDRLHDRSEEHKPGQDRDQ